MIVDSLMTTRVVTVHLDDKLTKLQEIFINTRFHPVSYTHLTLPTIE